MSESLSQTFLAITRNEGDLQWLQGALTPGGDARAEIRLVQAVDDGLDGVGRVVDDEDERAVAVYGVHYGLSRAAVGAVDVSAWRCASA